jgi:protoheme IX farnesyltransferase
MNPATLDLKTISGPRTWWGDLAELFKIRLTFLVLFTTLAGFYLGQPGATDYALLFHTLLGTALVAASAAGLNQLLERDIDAKMRRTENRPLPGGRMHPDEVLLVSFFCGVAGLFYLLGFVNLPTSLLAALTLGLYVFAYTPLKSRSTLNTLVGALPGALPPVIGWTAARGEIVFESAQLFAVLFLWQIPHFLAIAWLYRADYEAAGLKMLPVLDPEGRSTGRQAIIHILALIPVTLFPSFWGVTGTFSAYAALILGAGFLWFAVQFYRDRSDRTARRLFFASIAYLPLLLAIMAYDKS